MKLDDIVVICLAILFFGGIAYLSIKEGKKENRENVVQPPPTPQEQEYQSMH